MSSPLITLADGAVLDFKEEEWSSSGCDTCDYGSSYVTELEVITTAGTWKFTVDNMYEFALSHAKLLKAVLAVDKSQTVEQFIKWLEGLFNKENPESVSVEKLS